MLTPTTTATKPNFKNKKKIRTYTQIHKHTYKKNRTQQKKINCKSAKGFFIVNRMRVLRNLKRK